MDGYSNAQISNLLERASVIGYFKLRMSVYIEFCAYLLLYRKKMELVIESFENSTGTSSDKESRDYRHNRDLLDYIH